ncbi:MAG TPA: hypothetical protein VMU88_07910, partial [bacterium]|nr:hypothetical protein [bacterium]
MTSFTPPSLTPRPHFKILALALGLLALTAARAQAQFSVGVTLLISVTYTNGGTSTWNGVTITEPVPPQLTFLYCEGAPCSDNAGLVTWEPGPVAAGASGGVTYAAVISSCS